MSIKESTEIAYRYEGNAREALRRAGSALKAGDIESYALFMDRAESASAMGRKYRKISRQKATV